MVGATVAGAVDPTGIGLVVYATILGGYLLHGFVHLAQSFLHRGYAPGPATAIVLVIPVSLYIYWRLLAAGLIDIRVAAVTCLIGLVLFAPLIIGAGRLSVRVDRWLDRSCQDTWVDDDPTIRTEIDLRLVNPSTVHRQGRVDRPGKTFYHGVSNDHR